MNAKRTRTPKLRAMPPPEKSPTGMSETTPTDEPITALLRSHTEPLIKQLDEIHHDVTELHRGVTELTERCRDAEDRADELFDQFFDLMDALDSQDVIRVLEQHTPDCRRYQVDSLAAQIKSIWRRYWDGN
jgi:hypothetical protein